MTNPPSPSHGYAAGPSLSRGERAKNDPARSTNCHRPHLNGNLCLALLLLGIFWSVSAAWAGDRAAGRDKAAACIACHGLDGLSRQPDAPNIAGQNALYMRHQLRAYRSGKRTHPVMNVVAKDLSDADIDDLTAHYSSIKITVEMPE